MASSRRTYDTEMITLRQIFAYNSNNSVIPSSRVLTTDGRGGTFWAIPSTLGGVPAYNEIIANGVSIPADEPYNRLILSTSDGIGLLRNTETKEIRFYNKGFTQFDISGGNTLVGYSNNTLTPVVKFEGRGGIRVSGDPLTNTLFIQGVPTAISTAAYAFGQINVISNASTLTPEAIGNSNNSVLTATGPSTMLQVIGLGDIELFTNTTSNAYFIGISTFKSSDYLQLSNIAYTTYASSLSSVSSLFYDISQTGDATSSLKFLISNVSTGIDSNFSYFENFFITNYTSLNYFGLNSTATGNVITNIQSDIDYLYIQIGTIDVPNIRNISTATGSNSEALSSLKEEFSTKALFVSSLGVNCNSPQYTVDISGSLKASYIEGYPSLIDLTSTVTGLGSIGYLSSAILSNDLVSTVEGLGSVGYISTSILTSTIEGLGSLGYLSSAVLSNDLISSVEGLGSIGYISTSILTSTLEGLGSFGYLSTALLSNDLVSTVEGLGSIGYLSSAVLSNDLVSTVEGLGSTGYLSTSILTSTLEGLGSFGYLSTSILTSSIEGLGSIGYLSTAVFSNDLVSTVEGLGSIGYLSTSINFFSSLPALPASGTVNLGNFAGSNVILSSVSFTLDSMSSLFEKGATAYIKVFPSFAFDSNTSPTNILNVTTFIIRDSVLISNTEFERAWINGNTVSANNYTDSIQIELDNQIILSNITSTFTICHEFSTLNSSQNNYHLTSQKNSCFIHLCSPRM